MYQVSDAFRQAIADQKPQRVWMEFADRILTNEHILISTPLSYHEVYNSNSDMTVGECNSAEISFEINNSDHSFDDFGYGKFSVWIGVEVDRKTVNKANMESRIGNTLTVVRNKVEQTFELAPLGVFIAPKSKYVAKTSIQVNANDQMVLFDKPMPDPYDLPLIDWTEEVTVSDLLRGMCMYLNVPRNTDSFLNDDLPLPNDLSFMTDCTMRDVLAHIAELAGANARFNRNGELELTFFRETGKTFDEHDYTSFEPTIIKVPKVQSLTIRNANSTAESVVGEGDNRYLVRNNPILRQDDSPAAVAVRNFTPRDAEAEEETPASKLLAKLQSVPEYTPANADLFADWTMEAGDIYNILMGDKEFTVPVFDFNLEWNGSAFTTIESTGDEERQPIPALERMAEQLASDNYGELMTKFNNLNLSFGNINDAFKDFGLRLDALEGIEPGPDAERELKLDVLTVARINSTSEESNIDMNNVFIEDKLVSPNISDYGGDDGESDSLGLRNITYLQIADKDEVWGDTDQLKHYHEFEERNGRIYMTDIVAHETFFNIADTKKYKDDVSAALNSNPDYATAFSSGYTAGGEAAYVNQHKLRASETPLVTPTVLEPGATYKFYPAYKTQDGAGSTSAPSNVVDANSKWVTVPIGGDDETVWNEAGSTATIEYFKVSQSQVPSGSQPVSLLPDTIYQFTPQYREYGTEPGEDYWVGLLDQSVYIKTPKTDGAFGSVNIDVQTDEGFSEITQDMVQSSSGVYYLNDENQYFEVVAKDENGNIIQRAYVHTPEGDGGFTSGLIQGTQLGVMDTSARVDESETNSVYSTRYYLTSYPNRSANYTLIKTYKGSDVSGFANIIVSASGGSNNDRYESGWVDGYNAASAKCKMTRITDKRYRLVFPDGTNSYNDAPTIYTFVNVNSSGNIEYPYLGWNPN